MAALLTPAEHQGAAKFHRTFELFWSIVLVSPDLLMVDEIAELTVL